MMEDGVIFFISRWCPSCNLVPKLVSEIRKGGMNCISKFVEDCADEADLYNVSEVPAAIFFENGLPVKMLKGIYPVDRYL